MEIKPAGTSCSNCRKLEHNICIPVLKARKSSYWGSSLTSNFLTAVSLASRTFEMKSPRWDQKSTGKVFLTPGSASSSVLLSILWPAAPGPATCTVPGQLPRGSASRLQFEHFLSALAPVEEQKNTKLFILCSKQLALASTLPPALCQHTICQPHDEPDKETGLATS